MLASILPPHTKYPPAIVRLAPSLIVSAVPLVDEPVPAYALPLIVAEAFLGKIIPPLPTRE